MRVGIDNPNLIAEYDNEAPPREENTRQPLVNVYDNNNEEVSERPQLPARPAPSLDPDPQPPVLNDSPAATNGDAFNMSMINIGAF